MSTLRIEDPTNCIVSIQECCIVEDLVLIMSLVFKLMSELRMKT